MSFQATVQPCDTDGVNVMWSNTRQKMKEREVHNISFVLQFENEK